MESLRLLVREGEKNHAKAPQNPRRLRRYASPCCTVPYVLRAREGGDGDISSRALFSFVNWFMSGVVLLMVVVAVVVVVVVVVPAWHPSPRDIMRGCYSVAP